MCQQCLVLLDCSVIQKALELKIVKYFLSIDCISFDVNMRFSFEYRNDVKICNRNALILYQNNRIWAIKIKLAVGKYVSYSRLYFVAEIIMKKYTGVSRRKGKWK